MRLLVTGGAGYVGSVVATVLVERGHDVTVVDDLSTGHADAVPEQARFIEASIFDAATVIAHVSTTTTLLPGDLITMGRPAGIGTVGEPEVLLYPGVDMVTEIKGVGELRNSVVRSVRSEPWERFRP